MYAEGHLPARTFPMRRQCMEDGCPRLVTPLRCSIHTLPGPERGYDREHRHTSRRLIAAHLDNVGPWCPGWDERPPHAATDLVADHNVPRHPEAGYVVRCRGCNTARSNASGEGAQESWGR